MVLFSKTPHNIVEYIFFKALVYIDARGKVLTISIYEPPTVRDCFLGASLMQLTYFLKEVIFLYL